MVSPQPVDGLAGALRALEPLVLRLCEQATADLGAYERHTRLLGAHDELRAREALKTSRSRPPSHRRSSSTALPRRSRPRRAQLALACYSSGRILAAAPRDLARSTRAAFRSTLAMESTSRDG
ncbi:hypothetical protein [Clavibacter michiganensis]|uniref:hypothetical protein n=1 Tax=Clavibacter michiganensis TaxID=28447 RepID=UPI000B8E7238|nr:hypothetical protein [Clavibacter michiganensis]